MSDTPTLASALVELQASLPHVTKDAENPHFRSRYASLAALTDALLPAMTKLGLAWICFPTYWDDKLILRYEIHHAPSGERLIGEYPLPATGTPQQIGSAITYARRYALSAVTGLVADDDDDGNAAEETAPKPRTDAARNDAGLMTRAQQREHKALRTHEPSRPAERSNDPADDIWAGPIAAAEDQPGSSNSRQWQRLAMLYRTIGIQGPDIHADLTDRTGREITSAKDLGYLEAQAAITALEPIAEAMRAQEASS